MMQSEEIHTIEIQYKQLRRTAKEIYEACRK